MQKFEDVLVDMGFISLEQKKQLIDEYCVRGMHTMAVQMGLITDAQVADAVAKQFGLERHEFGSVKQDVLDMIPESLVRENRVIPVAADNNGITVAMDNPGDVTVMKRLQFILNRPVKMVVVSRGEFDQALFEYYARF